jgi:hypothetical protein
MRLRTDIASEGTLPASSFSGLSNRNGGLSRVFSTSRTRCHRARCASRSGVALSKQEKQMAEITEAQKAELKKRSKEARVPDMSEIVTTSEEAERRIRDLKEKARME